MIYLARALDAILVALLLWACVTDWRARIIPHWLNIAIALLAPIGWWVYHLPFLPHGLMQASIVSQVLLALVISVIFMGFQALGAMGGGDVKLLGALALWFHWPVMLTMLFLMSLAGGALTLALLVIHRMRRREERLEIPYGLAIAFAALVVICKQYFNQFA